MGYSATTPIKSWQAHARLHAFLKENLRPWHQLMPDDLGSRTPEADWTQRLTDTFAYDKGSCRLGFNLGTSGELRGHYGFSILRWMALVAGRKRNLEDFAEAVPYYVYDGRTCIPVLIRSTWEGKVQGDDARELVDEDGWMPVYRFWRPDPEDAPAIQGLSVRDIKECLLEAKYGARYDRADEIIKSELSRLSKLWAAYQETP
jgi:hypothetical protein